MFVVRPAERHDSDDIFALAKHLDTLNLPADKKAIAGIIGDSLDAFSGKTLPQQREFLFVLEDLTQNQVVGTSMVHAQHGTKSEPHVYLRVVRDEHYSDTLDKYMVHQCLQMGYNYDGPTEIGGLILKPSFRGHPLKLGKLLSYVRFLYIAMHRELFKNRVISELLPPLEDDGTSKLWKHFGKRFTELPYQEADRLSKNNKEFIKSLFPTGLVYTNLFPSDVQNDIGKVGKQTQGVKAMLQKIGFEYANQIDPFDGGPHYIAKTDKITLVKAAGQKSVAIGKPSSKAKWTLLATQTPFRATAAMVESHDSSLVIDKDVASNLTLKAGDPCWSVVC